MPNDKSLGLYSKYSKIERADGSSKPGGKHHSCRYFVLDLEHDPYAVPALMSYARECHLKYPKLAKDLERLAQELLHKRIQQLEDKRNAN